MHGKDFSFEVAALRRVVLEASLLGSLAGLAACGGAVAVDDVDGSASRTTVPTTPPPTTTSQPPTITPCPWTFACAPDDPSDAGPIEGGTGLPPCSSFTGDYAEREACKTYCFGASASCLGARSPRDHDVSYLACRAQSEAGSVSCAYELPGGRRPDAYVPVATARDGGVGAWLAGLAHLETASVDAFRILAAELTEHDAPPSLVAAAERAARDEIRHAAMVSRLAIEHGAQLTPPPRSVKRLRSLFELARENAVEGCVRETYGALVCMWQAEAAADPRFRKQMAAIASDEARHAALAWHVARWAESRLDEEANARVRAARQLAEAELDEEIAAAPESEAWHWLGLPSREEAKRLRTVFREDGLSAA